MLTAYAAGLQNLNLVAPKSHHGEGKMDKQGSKRKPNKNFRAIWGPKNRISLHSGTYWPVSILIKEIFMGVPLPSAGPLWGALGFPWGSKVGNRHEKLPLYAVVLNKKYLRGDATLCCPFRKKRISLGSKGQKRKKKKVIKKALKGNTSILKTNPSGNPAKPGEAARQTQHPKGNGPPGEHIHSAFLARRSKTRNTKI